MKETCHICVIGAGSVGQRHMNNLRALGCDVSCCDPREDRRERAKVDGSVGVYPSHEEALSAGVKFDGAVVASPTAYHTVQAGDMLRKGIPVLLEKPVSIDTATASELMTIQKDTKVPLLLGYTYRWWPPLQKLKESLQEGTVGRILHVRSVMSAHLQDWHPWEKYQEFFMSSKDLGGGALLDESHVLDLMVWMFGMPQSLFADVSRISDLEITSDDNVDIWMSFKDGMRISIHLDLFARPHDRSIIAVGEKGSLRWTFDPNAIDCSSDGSRSSWKSTSFHCERNDMFVGVAREFLDVLKGAEVSCDLQAGYKVMQLIEAARESSSTGKVVLFGEEAES